MRKNLIKFTIVALCIVTNSCGNEADSSLDLQKQKSVSMKSHKTINLGKFSNEELNRFVNNENLQKIIQNIEAYKKASAIDDVEGQHKAIDIIISSSHSLVQNYGGEKQIVLDYFNELQINDSTPSQKYYYGNGDQCHRNSNGTINTDACSFWEEVVVAFSGAFGCTRPEAGSSSSSWNTYYNCYQNIVCKTC